MNERIKQYADLAVEVGLNVQKGDPVVIRCPIEGAYFARLLAKSAYENGAKEVIINWGDDELARMKLEYAPMEVLETVPDWAFEKSKYYLEDGAKQISIHAEDPEAFKGVDPKRLQASTKASLEKFKPLQHYTMNDECSWTVISIPTKGWAKRVFPDLSEDEAVEKLWDKILDITRMKEEDPIKAWEDHLATLDAKADFLNSKDIRFLHYQNGKGTDLKVELPEGHIWLSSGSTNAKGEPFVPNMPTEEVFTLPKRDGVNGTLYATKPLAFQGTVIKDMRFEFKDGKVVDYSASEGLDSLETLLGADENAKYLGEVALVPYDSPISNSNILFFNTLFDENASCHFAFGQAYPTCLEGGADMEKEELFERGVNDSLVHVDFMVGSADLSITATTRDGETFKVFENGNWAF